jgi:two-component system KDP operon response regulator KdpE
MAKPVYSNPSVSPPARATGSTSTSALPNLLIVESDPAVAFVLRALLHHGRMTCEVAPWSLPVLEHASAAFDIVIMDLDLSEEESFRRIEELRGCHSIPLIVLSGQSGEADKVRALDAGADDFIVKPFFPSELLARIRALLRRGATHLFLLIISVTRSH